MIAMIAMKAMKAMKAIVKIVINRILHDIDDLNAHSTLQKDLYNYLMNDDNRQAVMKRAIELHNGDLRNNLCIFCK